LTKIIYMAKQSI